MTMFLHNGDKKSLEAEMLRFGIFTGYLNEKGDKRMKVGFDYWQVLSHYKRIGKLLETLHDGPHNYYDVHVISAIGKNRIGTIPKDVHGSLGWKFPEDHIHEVVFDKSKQSPELKLAKCKELGIVMFFDDRQDVCDLLNANGILAFKVPRKGESYIAYGDAVIHKRSDREAERK